METLLMTKRFWMDSKFSIVRFSKQLRIDGQVFQLVPPNEDLVRKDIIPAYIKFGRDRIIQLIESGHSAEDIKAELKETIDKQKEEQDKQQLNLF